MKLKTQLVSLMIDTELARAEEQTRCKLAVLVDLEQVAMTLGAQMCRLGKHNIVLTSTKNQYSINLAPQV